ncbi:hypothetical protein NPIL_301651 [Nephila pilipes]|uniref:Uncharacterized protein n=1 Tax=Nephila pilipes TaxID=299642 RepID=A0A8X6U258_NEPPI|nr:hypothetical protein NPIL_301651 [Nephila pilipes]
MLDDMLGYRKIPEKLVSRNQTSDHETARMGISLDQLMRHTRERIVFLFRIITGDETPLFPRNQGCLNNEEASQFTAYHSTKKTMALESWCCAIERQRKTTHSKAHTRSVSFFRLAEIGQPVPKPPFLSL